MGILCNHLVGALPYAHYVISPPFRLTGGGGGTITPHTRRAHLCFRVHVTDLIARKVTLRLLSTDVFISCSRVRRRPPLLAKAPHTVLEHLIDAERGEGGERDGGAGRASASLNVIAHSGAAAGPEDIGLLSAFRSRAFRNAEALPDGDGLRILDDNEIAVGLASLFVGGAGVRVAAAAGDPAPERQEGEAE